MEQGPIYTWETLPEWEAMQQYSRCLGRVFRSLGRRKRRRVEGPLTCAALRISHGIVGFNADVPPPERLSAAEREAFRQVALDGIRASSEGLRGLAGTRRVDTPNLLVAQELLERIEAWVRDAESRPDWL